MANARSVFIVGAGSSAEYGLPKGRGWQMTSASSLTLKSKNERCFVVIPLYSTRFAEYLIVNPVSYAVRSSHCWCDAIEYFSEYSASRARSDCSPVPVPPRITPRRRDFRPCCRSRRHRRRPAAMKKSSRRCLDDRTLPSPVPASSK